MAMMNSDRNSRAELLRKKMSLGQYLAELELLLGGPVPPEDLIDLQKTKEIRAEAKQIFEQQGAAISTFPVDYIRSQNFQEFIAKLRDANPSPIYVWTPRTIDCGTYAVPRIDDIQFQFDASVSPEGILSFLTTDFDDTLLLDLTSKTSTGDTLTIETKGKNWSLILPEISRSLSE